MPAPARAHASSFDGKVASMERLTGHPIPISPEDLEDGAVQDLEEGGASSAGGASAGGSTVTAEVCHASQ